MLKLAAILILTTAGFALAFPPPGTDLSSPSHLWWECHRMPGTGASCCSETDGHSLGDANWKIGPGGYQVQVEGHWWNIPGDTVLEGDLCGADPNVATQSDAKVWYAITRGMDNAIASIKVFCFKPGSLY